jgi:hypothetical protein
MALADQSGPGLDPFEAEKSPLVTLETTQGRLTICLINTQGAEESLPAQSIVSFLSSKCGVPGSDNNNKSGQQGDPSGLHPGTGRTEGENWGVSEVIPDFMAFLGPPHQNGFDIKGKCSKHGETSGSVGAESGPNGANSGFCSLPRSHDHALGAVENVERGTVAVCEGDGRLCVFLGDANAPFVRRFRVIGRLVEGKTSGLSLSCLSALECDDRDRVIDPPRLVHVRLDSDAGSAVSSGNTVEAEAVGSKKRAVPEGEISFDIDDAEPAAAKVRKMARGSTIAVDPTFRRQRRGSLDNMVHAAVQERLQSHRPKYPRRLVIVRHGQSG